MEAGPVRGVNDLLYFTDGSLAYAGRYRHDPGHHVHTHSFVEVAVVTGGEGVHVSVAGHAPLTVGDVVLLRPGVWHGYEDCTRLEVFNCCFATDLLHRELAWTREDPLLGYLLWTGPYSLERRGVLATHLDEPALAACVEHLDALERLRSARVGLHRGDIIGRLALFLSALARAVAGEDAEEPTSPTHPAVLAAMRLMEARPEHRWTLRELADRLHLAPGYLVRLFKCATGLPPMAYLTRHRVELAATRLLHTDQPIAQIARSVGWPDQNYFARRFKLHFGLSASVYRTRFSHDAARLVAGDVVKGRV
ncbi:AraC family transcriptional regulator [Actinophytocola algeriensis]|uniref:AraC family L-rhamnose operon transcriptional activator RhaR n=1 Tax=Actinophytocola algeriensis TaxID=1768010 RepID=A0A7W7QC97_9PSEU|nr:AraC family transcriptional regulator [Actinophytocola algeriensis]MBB4910997.1 AraC family L-rhamnose operon transcriptional activator RhaR [Actinophytocola algeriensis]MBE1473990.1 AraC family L-rhamnose operon transcriptional activator RhaR [Actinophytocola algeriensis]